MPHGSLRAVAVTAQASADPPRSSVRHGHIELDFGARRATLAGEELTLTEAELALLLHFARRPNQLITRSELLARVWRMPMHTGSNLVDVVVCRLRRRLGAQGRMIETVRGLGYRFRPLDDGGPDGTSVNEPRRGDE